MAILTKFCACGTELKNKKSIRCRKCATQKRFREQNIDWQPEEVTTLKVYASLCIEIVNQKKKLEETKNVARALRISLAKRHSNEAVHSKIGYLKSQGVIKREEWTYVKI